MGWKLRRPLRRRAPHTALASLMEVKIEESTHGVDNSYKYLINKDFFKDQSDFH